MDDLQTRIEKCTTAAEGSKAAAERTEAKIDKSAAQSAADRAEIKKIVDETKREWMK